MKITPTPLIKTDDKPDSRQSGSALLMAVFVLTLVTMTGVSLLFLGTNELKMSQRSVELKRAFYFAEAGEEAARTALYLTNGNDDFSDELIGLAGPGVHPYPRLLPTLQLPHSRLCLHSQVRQPLPTPQRQHSRQCLHSLARQLLPILQLRRSRQCLLRPTHLYLPRQRTHHCQQPPQPSRPPTRLLLLPPIFLRFSPLLAY